MKNAIKKAIEGGYEYNCGKGLFFKGDGQRCEFGGVNSDFTIWTRLDNGSSICVSHEDVLLDPIFWQSLGKQQGWDYESERFYCPKCEDQNKTNWCNKKFCMECGGEMSAFTYRTKRWVEKWHDFIDNIALGGNIDDFFNELLK